VLVFKFFHSSAPSQPPTNVQVPVINPREVELVWAPPPMDKQNGIIRRYIINVTSVDDGEELITYSQTTNTLVQNLHPFTTYACSVSAETVNPGPFSPPIVVQTPEDGKITAFKRSCNATRITNQHLFGCIRVSDICHKIKYKMQASVCTDC